MTTQNTTDSKGEALKPCPFCGSDAIVFSGFLLARQRVVECVKCRSRATLYGSGAAEENETRAIKSWNSRAPLAAVEEDAHRIWTTVFNIVSNNCDQLSRDVIKKLEAARDEDGVGPAATSPAPAGPPNFISEVDQWKHDLTTAGWIAETALNWRAPDGSLWRGPAGAWKELQRRSTPTPVQPEGEQERLKKRARQVIDAVINSPCVVETRFFSQVEEQDKLEDEVARMLAATTAPETAVPLPAAGDDEAERRAIAIVGTVFDNTAASPETLKRTTIERIAAALRSGEGS